VPEVRLIGADGEALGVLSTDEAKLKAKEAGLDLVEISPTAKPPVCKIMDYNKFLYQQQKKLALAKKKQKQVQVKELTFRPGTEEGDLKVKLRKMTEFLENGDKVKITVRLRGREVAHKDLVKGLFERIEKHVEEFAIVELPPKYEDRLTASARKVMQIIMVLAPKKTK
jgi:translation initiation factor IF-3